MMSINELQFKQQAYRNILLSIKKEMEVLKNERKNVVKQLERIGTQIADCKKNS